MGTKYATARELRGIERELDSLRAIEGDPYKFGSIENKNDFRKRKKDLESRVAKESPPPVSSEERKSLEARSELLKSYMLAEVNDNRKPAMTSKQEEWETPAGATGKHRQWNDKVNNWTVDDSGKVVRSKYGAMAEWKDIQTRLTPRDEQEVDPDFRSFERYRPDHRDQSSLSEYRRRSFAQGAGISKEQWESTVGPKEPQAQCQKMKKDGSACTATALAGRDCCLAHSKE